jgi:HPt (histidine-containing phosphotransfer) domain-containing protein
MRRLAKTRKDRERENCELGERLSQPDSQRIQSERERLARRGSEGEEAKEAPLSFSLAAAPPQDPAAPVGQAERPSGVFDLDAAVSRCYGNYDMFQEMTRHLCGEADPLLDQMRAAHAAGNARKLADTAHRLLGTVLYLAAAPALEAAKCVEAMGRAGELSAASAAVERLAGEVARLKDALRDHCPRRD